MVTLRLASGIEWGDGVAKQCGHFGSGLEPLPHLTTLSRSLELCDDLRIRTGHLAPGAECPDDTYCVRHQYQPKESVGMLARSWPYIAAD
jgi:hypothetical protein